MIATPQDTSAALLVAAAWFDPATIEPLGNGHIHQTYLLRDRGEPAQHYVLQRINRQVYRDIALLDRQTMLVIGVLSADTNYAKTYRVPQLVATPSGDVLHIQDTEEGNQAWRLWRFVEDSMSCDPPTNRQQIYAAAEAFGAYQRAIAELQPEDLAETIPGFLDMPSYLQGFDAVLAACKPSERTEAAQWIELVQSNRHWPDSLLQRSTAIHGDCKINNLLFDANGQRVLSVIDLDNNMIGHWAWDFGDLVRSVTYSRGQFDALDYRACVEGFLQGRKALPNSSATTKEHLVAAPRFLAFMLGLRFLTDHLNGDQYFTVPRHGDNLQRAIEQFELYRVFQNGKKVMRDLVDQVR